MVVRIRFAMHGTRNNRIFHLVAINQRQRRNAKPLELLGIYDPRLAPDGEHKTVQWSVDRIRYWLNVGAVPSKSAVKLLEMVSRTSSLNLNKLTKALKGNILLRGSPYHPTTTTQTEEKEKTPDPVAEISSSPPPTPESVPEPEPVTAVPSSS